MGSFWGVRDMATYQKFGEADRVRPTLSITGEHHAYDSPGALGVNYWRVNYFTTLYSAVEVQPINSHVLIKRRIQSV